MNTTKIKGNTPSSMMKMMHLALFSLLVLFIASCQKTKETSHLTVQMTDAPANYGAVMIDLKGVEIIHSNSGTVTLNTTEGMYNLLDLTNGKTTLIATGDLDAGTVSQIRLILGTNNTVTVNNVVYPLSTPSAQQSGLKLQVNQVLEPGISYSILLDFDANQSIVSTGNGTYQLKPVIRTIDAAITGAIKGSITPVGAIATITATSNSLIYSSVASVTGNFLISGLPAGTYEITVTPVLPLLPVTVTGKIVTIGVTTDLGVLAL
jgi:hypothetical protein